jgi:hypothetical protein
VVAVPIMAAVMLVVSGKKELQLPRWLLGMVGVAVGLMIWSSWSSGG